MKGSDMKLHGIKNCNTVKKALDWCDTQGLAYEFHDYKKQSPDEAVLKSAMEKWGWEKVINRAGMTWRKLSDDEKNAVNDDASAMALAMEKPSVIKRPIVTDDNGAPMVMGFKDAEYEAVLSS